MTPPRRNLIYASSRDVAIRSALLEHQEALADQSALHVEVDCGPEDEFTIKVTRIYRYAFRRGPPPPAEALPRIFTP